MSQIDIKQNIDYYRQKILTHGLSAEGMDWKNKKSQYLRFDIISRYIDFNNCPSILDVGCGSGEFIEFCNERNQNIDYTGIDACSDMVELCQKRFGNNTFFVRDVLDLNLSEERHDFVIASGTFNVKLDTPEEDWNRYHLNCIQSMFDACRVATIFNIMTTHVDFRYDHLFYEDPGSISQFIVSNLTRKFVIDHSYPLYEMTIAIFKS